MASQEVKKGECTPLPQQILPEPALYCPVPSRRSVAVSASGARTGTVFKDNVRYPIATGPIQMLNPEAYFDKEAKGYTAEKSRYIDTPVYDNVNDSRMINSATGQRIKLSHPPIDGELPLSEMYNKRRVRHGGPLGSYASVGSGQIVYYVDDSIRDAFFQPNFTQKVETIGIDYVDPMGSHKPQYYRVPLKYTNQVTHPSKTDEEFGLSSLRDSTIHREDIMASQMRVRNQQRWEPYHTD